MKVFNPGDLKHQVIIQQQVFTDDPDTGESKASWQDTAKVWAAVEPLRGREFFQSLEVHSELTISIRILYRAGITNDMRIKYGTRLFTITAVIDPEECHRELQLMCVESAPPGPGED